MLKKLVPLLSLTLLFVKCGNVLTEEGKALLSLDDKVEYETELISFSKSAADCTSNCTGVTLSYEKVKDNTRLNQAIENEVIKQLRYFVKNGDRLTEKEDLGQEFLNDYKEFKQAFPESNTPWNVDLTGDVTYAANGFVTYKLVVESYTGGAHNNTEVIFLNLDNNGAEASLMSKVTDRGKLLEVAEASFRKEKSVGPAADLGDAGFTFEDNRFQLPDNMGLGKRGLILYYNDYEIASHADGPTEVIVPYAQLEGIIEL